MHNDFLSRFEVVLEGVKPNPWFDWVGLGRGPLTAMKRGSIPSGPTLSTLMRVARVSSNFLLEGEGSPFLVKQIDNDAEIAIVLDEMVSTESWQIYLVGSDELLVCVLTLPATYQRAGEPEIQYTDVEVISGKFGQLTRSKLDKFTGLSSIKVEEETAQDLATGWLGNVSLLGIGDQDGLLSQSSASNLDWSMFLAPHSGRVAEPRDKNDYLPKASTHVDPDLLGQILEALEEELDSRNLELAPKKKARAAALLYELYAEEEDKTLDKGKVSRFLKLAG